MKTRKIVIAWSMAFFYKYMIHDDEDDDYVFLLSFIRDIGLAEGISISVDFVRQPPIHSRSDRGQLTQPLS